MVTPLILSVSLAEAVVRVEIRATDGRLVGQQSFGRDAAPLHVPIGALPSGLYLCSVVTAMATHTAHFTIVQ